MREGILDVHLSLFRQLSSQTVDERVGLSGEALLFADHHVHSLRPRFFFFDCSVCRLLMSLWEQPATHCYFLVMICYYVHSLRPMCLLKQLISQTVDELVGAAGDALLRADVGEDLVRKVQANILAAADWNKVAFQFAYSARSHSLLTACIVLSLLLQLQSSSEHCHDPWQCMIALLVDCILFSVALVEATGSIFSPLSRQVHEITKANAQ